MAGCGLQIDLSRLHSITRHPHRLYSCGLQIDLSRLHYLYNKCMIYMSKVSFLIRKTGAEEALFQLVSVFFHSKPQFSQTAYL